MFKFCMPTKIFFGQGCVAENAAQMKELGKRAFIVTGRNSSRLNGSLQDMQSALEANNIPYYIFDQITSNPSIQLVRQAAGIAKAEKVDFIIGIGGGSPLDAAKAIAILTANDIDDEALFAGPYPNPVLPVVAVPTTAGTGSEVTQYSILTDDRAETKTSIANEIIFPKIAFLDARYTEKLPKQVTINTAIDALSHAVEGYLSVKATDMSDIFAARSMELLGECLTLLHKDIDITVREKLLYASMLAGIVIAHTGTTAVHSMGYSLTYFKDIDHGRANGLLLYEYLKFIAAQYQAKVDEVVALLGAESLHSLGDILNSLLGDREPITAEEIELFSAKAITAKNIANTLVKPSQQDLADIMQNSMS